MPKSILANRRAPSAFPRRFYYTISVPHYNIIRHIWKKMKRGKSILYQPVVRKHRYYVRGHFSLVAPLQPTEIEISFCSVGGVYRKRIVHSTRNNIMYAKFVAEPDEWNDEVLSRPRFIMPLNFVINFPIKPTVIHWLLTFGFSFYIEN